MNNIYKVGIYLRLSNEDKEKKNTNSESIKNQRNMLIDYINNHNNFILYDEYVDEDLSGAGTYRPQFERLIKDCENHIIDIVLCKSQSRFSRDMEIIEKYINNKFKQWNIRFISIADNADTTIKGNKKSRQINGLVNEWYLEDVSNNIRSAFKSKMKAGEFISPFAAYGYKISKDNNNKLEIDDNVSNIIKKIYNLYLNGYGYSYICNYLNNNNIPSPSLYKYNNGCKLNIRSNKKREDIKWNINAIKNILTNELYIGNLIQGKRSTVSYKNHKIIYNDKSKWIKKENVHDAIIDIDTFNKVNKQIKERTKVIKRTNKVHNLSGKVYCNICKNYMRKKNSSKHSYLVCNNCINKSIRYDKLEDILLNKINEVINNYYDINILHSLINKNIYTNKIKYLNSNLMSLNNKLNNINFYLKNIYEDKVNNVIDNDNFNTLLNIYNSNKNIISNNILSIKKDINKYKANNNILDKYKEQSKLNRVIIEEFIDKIYIDNNDKKIVIYWNM